jgi:hypothetical protein
MNLTREDALKTAAKFLSDSMQGHLEIVDHISEVFYNPGIDVEKCWIVHVLSGQLILDGPQYYILVDKGTGAMTSINSNGCG